MNIETTANSILLHLTRRGIGHTSLMVSGLRNTKNAILVLDHLHQIDYIEYMCDRRIREQDVVQIRDLDYQLYGRCDPIAIDHTAIAYVIRGLQNEIIKLNKANNSLRTTLATISKKR